MSKLGDNLPHYPRNGCNWYSTVLQHDTLSYDYQNWVLTGSKGAPPSTDEENYDFIKRVWSENNFKSLKDLLVYYNEAEAGPLVKACEALMGCFRT